MAIRPAKCYKKLERPYVRQSKRKPKKGYVKGVPASKIHRFEVGNRKKKFSEKINIVAKTEGQIRSNALEAARIAANKILGDEIGTDAYLLKVLIFPHHVLRENTLATGAGADRFQTGMRKAYGKPIGLAARIKKNQKIITVFTNKSKVNIAKRALKIASSKFSVSCRIE